MTIYFHNPGQLDLDTIRTMGVNVKETETAIGYFGTGMKYAIAVLLRTGHKVWLETGGEIYNFTACEKIIRNKPFQVVFMNDEQLGFTTDLGKNWQVWMAYRELASNALDESGEISSRSPQADTIWAVSGPEIEKAHDRRRELFLSTKPLEIIRNVEIHQGATRNLYYRGVLVHQLPADESYAYTYNLLGKQDLTEDRTLQSIYGAHWDIRVALESAETPLDILQEIFAHRSRESDYQYGHLSENMEKAAEPHLRDASFNQSIVDMVRKKRENREGYPRCNLSSFEKEQVKTALKLLERLDCFITEDDFIITPTLGPNTYGIYNRKRNEIVIARTVVDKGSTFIASTLYEEYLHKEHGFGDCTREMQQFLFDRVIALASRLPD